MLAKPELRSSNELARLCGQLLLFAVLSAFGQDLAHGVF
jgi:hypothetical protein